MVICVCCPSTSTAHTVPGTEQAPDVCWRTQTGGGIYFFRRFFFHWLGTHTHLWPVSTNRVRKKGPARQLTTEAQGFLKAGGPPLPGLLWWPHSESGTLSQAGNLESHVISGVGHSFLSTSSILESSCCWSETPGSEEQ